MNERIREIIEFYHLSVRQFEEKIGSPNGKIYKALSRNSGVNADTISEIVDKFPNISPDWLLLGKGEMLRRSDPDGALSQPQSSDFVQKILADKDRRIEDLVRENERLRIEADGLREKLNSVLAPIPKESSSL